MAEYTEDLIEKLPRPPLVADPTTPTLASDGDDPGGFVVVIESEPAHGDVPVWDSVTRTWKGQAASGITPSYAWLQLTAIDGSGATVLVTDEAGNPILVYAPV